MPAHPELVDAFRLVPRGQADDRVFAFSPRNRSQVDHARDSGSGRKHGSREQVCIVNADVPHARFAAR